MNVKPHRYPYIQSRLSRSQCLINARRTDNQNKQQPILLLILLVSIKDGTGQFCIDYTALNTIITYDRFTTINYLFDELNSACYFFNFDLLPRYYLNRVHQDDVPKTTFCTHYEHNEFIVIPFCRSNVFSILQKTINDLFIPYLHQYIFIFFDDILIHSPSWTDPMEYFVLVLQLLHHYQLVAKHSKRLFGCIQLISLFLGTYILYHLKDYLSTQEK